ncbi:YesL family protein [Antribacter gilvus]|uniref:YesL family protein n=1 Tax=Antribacter gilvus TaxID=2304675 RepID=UPI000F7B301F|nr:DUF624 domain-containing protein [Antribacter gilvus]
MLRTGTRLLYDAADVLVWCVVLTLVWVTFTLAGAVVLGAAPASVAVVGLVRRRERGDVVHPWRDAARTWRAELWRSQPAVLPALAVPAVLWGNYATLSALGPDASAARLATLAAFVAAAGIGAWAPALYLHYDLPLRRFLPMASRLALARPGSTVVLLFTGLVLAVACAVVPVLALVGLGAWWHASTWLCLRFFAENEDRLAAIRADAEAPADRSGPPDRGAPTLPAEPLRIR